MSTLCVVCSAAISPSTTLRQRGCFSCVNRALAMLADLELWIPTLDATPHNRPDPGSPSRPFYGPRVIIDLDVVAALDRRTVPSDDDHVRSVVGSLAGINNAIRCERGEPERVTYNLTGELAYLRTRLAWCAGRDDFANVYADLRELHRQVEVLTRGELPFRIGRCPSVLSGRRCGFPLDAWPDDPAISCTRCGGTWTRQQYLELVDALAAADPATVAARPGCLLTSAALVALTGRPPITIRRHCTVVRYNDSGEALYDARAAVDTLAGVQQRQRPTRRTAVVDTSP